MTAVCRSWSACYYGRYNSHQAYEQIDYFNYYMRQERRRRRTHVRVLFQQIVFAVFLILITLDLACSVQAVLCRVITAAIPSQVTTRSWPHGLLKCPIEHATRVAPKFETVIVSVGRRR